METYRCDILVVGGGIAGLWTANRLLQDGWNVFLLEIDALGCGQTLASQGIMHSGVKYGIDGSNREIAQQLKTLPPRWMDCLAGKGEINLSTGRVLSPEQYFWSCDRLLGGFTSAMAGKTMQGEVEQVPKERWPEVIKANPPSGSLYAVKEAILDIQTVVAALNAPLSGRLLAGSIQRFEVNGGRLEALDIIASGGKSYRMEASAFVFAAGTGNEQAAEAFGFGTQVTQRRPLRMVMVKGLEQPIYGHCVTTSPKPRATITSHPLEGKWVWYIGGEVAEKGAALNEADTIKHAAQELGSIFPSINWNNKEFACHAVDRAEPRDSKGWLPSEPRLLPYGNAVLSWPTKLVYAPGLADRILDFIKQLQVSPAKMASPVAGLPAPTVGKLPWQQVSTWAKP